jgi:hypothetical protein
VRLVIINYLIKNALILDVPTIFAAMQKYIHVEIKIFNVMIDITGLVIFNVIQKQENVNITTVNVVIHQLVVDKEYPVIQISLIEK